MTDEDAIRRLRALWAECDADKDAKGWSELFTEDGKYISRRGVASGRAEIQRNLEERTASNPPDRHTMHIFGPGNITIDGDSAEAVSAYVAYGRIGDKPWEIMSIGRFYDKLVKRNGEWLFTSVENRAIGASGGPATSVREAAGAKSG
jgi:uncharacterized protein (TIGR02246 family)